MTSLSNRRGVILLTAMLLASAAAVTSSAPIGSRSAHAQAGHIIDVGGSVAADNACYVRLPDLPEERFGGFGAYNPATGVLTYAGGARKLGPKNTQSYYEMYAIRLDGSADEWQRVPYNQLVGYTQAVDKGCRGMFSVQLPAVGGTARWASVMGKDGCDNGAFDHKSRKGGDIKVLAVGRGPDSAQWVPGSGIDALTGDLAGASGKLDRPFATYDAQRGRLVFGQGTFGDDFEAKSRDEVYEAKQVGNLWKVSQLLPDGPLPARRFSSCAAYVYDEDTGVDGVLVLGGHSGGTLRARTYKEVWWLDFSGSPHIGAWVEITDRFANMDDMGYRRGGACAFKPDTKQFYSWMGRASSSVPDGAKRSGGVWRVDLTSLADSLADPSVKLTWQRLAKDNIAEIKGRRLIPSVYDWKNNRLFAIGGRNGLAALKDVWAIYPDVTGAACQNLDPYAPYRQPAPTARATRDHTAPQACDYLQGRVPAAAVSAALANPAGVSGYDQVVKPGLPESPMNPRRTWLALQNIAAPYHPFFNGLVYKAGCP